MIRIIIAGGRDFNNYPFLKETVDKILLELGIKTEEDKKNIEIISGKARGADTLGERYAVNNGISLITFPADWEAYGKAAGFIRNAEMANFASKDGNEGVLIAFWDGKSKGTKHMIDTAKKNHLKCYVNYYGCYKHRGE